MTISHGSNSAGILKEKLSITSYPSNGSTGGISLELLLEELTLLEGAELLLEEELLEDELVLLELLLEVEELLDTLEVTLLILLEDI